MAPTRKPTPAELQGAVSRTLTDVIAPNLKVLFCGINPGLYSAATGYHFARPGNRFWPTLYAAGFTDRLLAPSEQEMLLSAGYGITNLVARASARADELTHAELIEGGRILVQKAEEFRPRVVALLGVTVYRVAFTQPRATIGKQRERIGPALLWILPNPSGLNAHFKAGDLAKVFSELRQEVEPLQMD
jgi:double-stranded uracil-DNA glycosylase